jgi:glycosyltransferase involved in cell wall biosynthesis
MRVLFVTKPHLPAFGGAQLTIHHLALELKARGHSVAVLAMTDARWPPGDRDQIDRLAGYPTIRRPRLERTLALGLGALAPDVVVLNGNVRERERVAGILETVRHLPSVLYVHDLPSLSLSDAPADRLVVVSRFLAEQAARRGAAPDVVLPIVDAGAYRVSTTRRTALLVNPVPEKGVHTALALAERNPDVPFAFARCWWLRRGALAELRAEAARLGNVVIRDSVADPTVLYGDARVVLVPSVHPEAWGRVAREPQASGIPVIASDLGGLRESVGSGGVLVPADAGPDAWAAAFDRVWRDPREYARLSALAESQAMGAECSSRAVGDRFEAILEQAVSARRARPRAA